MDCALYLLDVAELADGARGNPVHIIRTLSSRVCYQGSQRHGKSWKTWKMKKAFSRPGKIMEFEKKAKIMEFQNTCMEKSWKFF